MRLSELLHLAGIAAAPTPDPEISGVSCDSRTAEGGILFVCIRGFSGDGHLYAAAAYAAGCRAFLAEAALDLPADAAVVVVENTRRALAKVGAAFYGFPAEKMKIIGITGTKGKTTTALMLKAILEQNHIVTGYIGTSGIDFCGHHFESRNTTPESIELAYWFSAMQAAGVQAVVMEVSSQALYLDRVYGIAFYAVAFTNLSPDHIGKTEHPTFEHYRDAKKKLFAAGGATYGVGNFDDPATAYMFDGFDGLYNSFGTCGGDFYAEDIRQMMEEGAFGVRFTLHAMGKTYPVTLPMPGKFNVSNALCAIALAVRLGVSLSCAVRAVAHAKAPGRFELVKTPLPAVFIIDYAHNFASLESVLTTLREYHPKKLWCVCGSVGGRTQSRRPEIGRALSLYCDHAVLTADNPDYEDPERICKEIFAGFVREIPCDIIPDRAEAIRFAAERAGEGDIVLLAGKGHEQYQLICGGRRPFSERVCLEKYAAEVAALGIK